MAAKDIFLLDNSKLFYETGVPCSKGHVSKRYKSTNQCLECLKEFKQLTSRKYRLSKYNMSEQEYKDMFAKQNYVCAICEQPETAVDGATQETKILSVDHCHNSDKVRGLLCSSCNLGLGKFKDNIKILQKAINYLKKNDPWLS